MPYRAIDVSIHQGTIDWSVVKANGVQAAWIKVGGSDSSNWYKDVNGERNMFGAGFVGLPFGTYYFARPTLGSGAAQARHAVETCHFGQGSLPPALDLEVHNGLSGGNLDIWALEFLREVERRIGRVGMVYTGAYIGMPSTGYFGSHPDLARYPLWIANYGNNVPGFSPPGFQPSIPRAWSEWSVWQFNSTTWQPGITENVTDQDVISDRFWAELTQIPQEWHMKRILVQGEAAQWRIVDDAFGVMRRQHIDSLELVSVLDGAGVTEGEYVLTNPAEIDRFKRIPEVTGPTAEWGMIAIVSKGVEQIGAHLDQHAGSIDAVAVGDALAAHLAEHLRD